MRYLVLNWKMNPSTLKEAKALFRKTKKGAIVCPPSIYLGHLKGCLGAQDVSWGDSYTGEIAPKMLKDMGCKYVLVGHSERSRYLGETEDMVSKKLRVILEEGLTPILFVGDESRKSDDDGLITDKVRRLVSGLDTEKIIFVYEPVWAISTEGGDSPASEEALRGRDAILAGVDKDVRVLYGGSVDSKTVNRYLEFDGVVVGRASLDPKEVRKIAKQL